MGSITAILLAGGLSARFGSDNKLLMPIGSDGNPMVRQTASRLCASNVARVIVVLGHEQALVSAALDGLPVETVFNPNFNDGQVTSVRAGLTAVGDIDDGEDCLGIMMCLSDQPSLNTADYNVLIDAFEHDPTRIAVPFVAEKRGNPVVMPASMRYDVLNGGANVGVRSFMDQHPDLVNAVSLTQAAFRNDIDTLETFEAIENSISLPTQKNV